MTELDPDPLFLAEALAMVVTTTIAEAHPADTALAVMDIVTEALLAVVTTTTIVVAIALLPELVVQSMIILLHEAVSRIPTAAANILQTHTPVADLPTTVHLQEEITHLEMPHMSMTHLLAAVTGKHIFAIEILILHSILTLHRSRRHD